MPKVTESLRRQWAQQKEQMIEERTETQSGRPRSAEDIALVDTDIAVMDRLLALPLGTKFDGQAVYAEVIKERQGSSE